MNNMHKIIAFLGLAIMTCTLVGFVVPITADLIGSDGHRTWADSAYVTVLACEDGDTSRACPDTLLDWTLMGNWPLYCFDLDTMWSAFAIVAAWWEDSLWDTTSFEIYNVRTTGDTANYAWGDTNNYVWGDTNNFDDSDTNNWRSDTTWFKAHYADFFGSDTVWLKNHYSDFFGSDTVWLKAHYADFKADTIACQSKGDTNTITVALIQSGLATAANVSDALDSLISNGNLKWITSDGDTNTLTVALIQSGLATGANVTDALDSMISNGNIKWVTSDGDTNMITVSLIQSGLATSVNVSDALDSLISNGNLKWITSDGDTNTLTVTLIQSGLATPGDAMSLIIGSITADVIANGAIDSTAIADSTFITEHFVPGFLDSTLIANEALTLSAFDDGYYAWFDSLLDTNTQIILVHGDANWLTGGAGAITYSGIDSVVFYNTKIDSINRRVYIIRP